MNVATEHSALLTLQTIELKLELFVKKVETSMAGYDANTMMAFVDILGFKALLRQKPLAEVLTLMNSILDADESTEYSPTLKIERRLVSDTFVLWSAIEEQKHITAFWTCLGNILARIHKQGSIITRGSIAVGDHYFDKDVWISPVFVEAYEMENKKGPPRIVLAPSAIKYINELYPNFLDVCAMVDESDGAHFFPYLNYAGDAYAPVGTHVTVSMRTAIADGSVMLQAFGAHKKMIEGALVKFPEHKAKYQWLARYHNRHVRNRIQLAGKEALLVTYED